ncbi:MAG: hypothetical protein QW101_06520 [Ignisphaera sp.]|uniref:Uncharacterized protein n=1 Tax=Ignisphaera aggregans TaxID=334771 RepID=A0A7J3MXB2_9CREN
MTITKRALVLITLSISITLAVAGVLMAVAQPPLEVLGIISMILDNVVTSIVMIIVFIFVLILGIVMVFTSDNEYVVALGALLSFISILIIVIIIPRLVSKAEESINQFFENIYEELKP